MLKEELPFVPDPLQLLVRHINAGNGTITYRTENWLEKVQINWYNWETDNARFTPGEERCHAHAHIWVHEDMVDSIAATVPGFSNFRGHYAAPPSSFEEDLKQMEEELKRL